MELLKKDKLIQLNGGYADTWNWLGETTKKFVNAMDDLWNSVVEGANSGARKSPI